MSALGLAIGGVFGLLCMMFSPKRKPVPAAELALGRSRFYASRNETNIIVGISTGDVRIIIWNTNAVFHFEGKNSTGTTVTIKWN